MFVEPTFPGVLWTHAPFPFQGAAPELQSHYESGPMAPARLLQLPPAGSQRHLWPIPDCVRNGQIPCLGQPSWVHVGTGLGEFSAMIGNVGALDATQLYPSAPALAATDLLWTYAAEPAAMIRSDRTLRLVATSLDGALVPDVLRLTAYGYTPADWRPACPGGPNCGPSTCVDPQQCFPATHAPGGDPLFVLSAMRGELFVITTGIEAVDLDTPQLDGHARRAVPLGGGSLGTTLLAATYDALSDRLFVIDDVPGTGPLRRVHQARLVSIDPDAGGMTVLASWPRLSTTSVFALGAAQDGRLYLAASGTRGGHVLISLEIAHHPASHHLAAYDEVIPRGIDGGPGVLLSDTTYASAYYVTFVVTRDGYEEVVAYSPGTPHFHSGDCTRDVF